MVVKLIAGYNSLSLLHGNPSSRETSMISSSSKFVISKHKSRVSFGAKIANTNKHARRLVVYANSVPGVTPPTGSNPKNWILGLVITFVLPFFSNKWGPLWVLKRCERLSKMSIISRVCVDRIDGAAQIVENIAEKVEDLAEEVDKIVEDIVDDLPEGKLKTLAGLVEDVAEKTAKAADALDDVIDQVQVQEAEVSLVESIEKETKKSSTETKESYVKTLSIEAKNSSLEGKGSTFVEPISSSEKKI